MSRDEFLVLVQVDGARTVKEITESSQLEEITVVSILGKLAEAGVVLVKAERQSRAEDVGELQAHRDSVWAEVSQLLDDTFDTSSGADDEAAEGEGGFSL
jgi:predicted transcriptional regulator